MKDPYKVLGVSPDASNDEIKKAYHNMAKKYHPDNYANTDLSSLAAEKMKEVNEAYDAIKAQRSGTGAGPSGGTYANNNTFSEELVRARQYFQTGRLTEANTLLEGMPQKDRNAEWNFIKGCVMIKRHWYYDAVRYLETACYMDPENREYRDMLDRVQKAGDGYNNTGRTDSSVNGCSVCDVCSSLLCANCLCNLCGGDMIHCC